MVNCVTNASHCLDVIMATVIQALNATAIKAGMVCFVEMVCIVRTKSWLVSVVEALCTISNTDVVVVSFGEAICVRNTEVAKILRVNIRLSFYF
jgi:hypothetical protein